MGNNTSLNSSTESPREILGDVEYPDEQAKQGIPRRASKGLGLPRIIVILTIQIKQRIYDADGKEESISVVPTQEHITRLSDPDALPAVAREPDTDVRVEMVDKDETANTLSVTVSSRATTTENQIIHYLRQIYVVFTLEKDEYLVVATDT